MKAGVNGRGTAKLMDDSDSTSRYGGIGGAVAAALFGASAMAALQTFSPHLPGNDGYYHLKMALLLPELGFVQEFPWLRWTIFREQFVSHHHGFHGLLAPFAVLSQWLTGDAVLGGKAAAAAAMAATFVILWLLVRELGARPALIWPALLFAAPWHFWMRMAYVRAPMAALPLLLLAAWLCLRGRLIALGVLGFVFAHVYGGAVLFPLIPLALLAGSILVGESVRPGILLCAAAAAGLLAGTLIHPYFPANLRFLYTQLFETGLGAPEHVGSEWRPFNGWNLLVQSAPLGLAWLWCLTRRLQACVRTSGHEIGLLLLNAGFLVLTLKARRFVEYWPVFALLNAACFHARWLAGSAAPAAEAARGRSFAPSGRLAWIVGAVIVAAGAVNLGVARDHVDPSHDVAAIAEAMAYLRGHSEPGSLVLTDDWDLFPTCFYFSHHNTYAVGLDPEFTRTRYPILWERYRRITRGEIPAHVPPELLAERLGRDDPAGSQPSRRLQSEITYADIAECFGAQYVLVADDHRKLYRALIRQPERFRRVYPAGESSAQPPISIFSVLADAASSAE